jgi:hypothetical protein
MSSSAKIFGTSKHEKALNKFYDSGAAKQCPPDTSAHISTHSVVKISESETRAAVIEALRKKHLIELENAYEKAHASAPRPKVGPFPRGIAILALT